MSHPTYVCCQVLYVTVFPLFIHWMEEKSVTCAIELHDGTSRNEIMSRPTNILRRST